MSWNQVEETISPSLEKAKDKAGDMVQGEEKVAIISRDKIDKITGQQWWKIEFDEYHNGPKVIVEDSP